jgi:hypothetical protein
MDLLLAAIDIISNEPYFPWRYTKGSNIFKSTTRSDLNGCIAIQIFYIRHGDTLSLGYFSPKQKN